MEDRRNIVHLFKNAFFLKISMKSYKQIISTIPIDLDEEYIKLRIFNIWNLISKKITANGKKRKYTTPYTLEKIIQIAKDSVLQILKNSTKNYELIISIISTKSDSFSYTTRSTQ